MADTLSLGLNADELQIHDWNGNTLDRTITDGIKECQSLDILVGYFYFNGIEAVRKALEANPNIILRILVGLEAGTGARGVVEYAQRHEWEGIQALTEEERNRRKSEYIDQLRKVIGDMAQETDDTASREIAALYIEMIKLGRLQIKQTAKSNHAKLYIFNQKQDANSFYLVGSSNFSKKGIADSERHELNAEIHRVKLDHVRSLFAELWANALPLTSYAKPGSAADQAEGKDQLIDMIEHETHLGTIAPYDAYLLVMRRFLELQKGTFNKDDIRWEFERSNFDYLHYQSDAVSKALTILKKSNGVLIADVVGLGKSVMASAIAACSRMSGIILCPPHLISDWEGGEDDEGKPVLGYFELFRLTGWRAFSMYQLDNVKNHIKKNSTDMIIVDEAHRFRNNTLPRYSDLKSLCTGRKVVLMTATPFNNRPRDIYALLGLFYDPTSKVPDGNTFENAMGDLDKSYLKKVVELRNPEFSIKQKKEIRREIENLAEQTFQIMGGVTIRRNRLDLKANPDYAIEVAERLSEQKPPIKLEYKLTGASESFFDKVVGEYFGGKKFFKGVIYRPAHYLKNPEGADAESDNQMQENYYGMLCRFLVNRFESSFAAFQKSIESVKSYCETALAIFEKEGVLILSREFFDQIEDAQDGDDFDFAKELEKYRKRLADRGPGKTGKRKSLKSYKTGDFDDPEVFKQLVRNDIELLTNIGKEIIKYKLLEDGNDPKLSELIKHVRHVVEGKYCEKCKIQTAPSDPLRKVIIFSVFADTVEYIGKRIKKEFEKDRKERVLWVTGRSDSSDPDIEILADDMEKKIIRNFDAMKGTMGSPIQILITTDKISEGMNLNQAGLVVNYDIPWNPTRVIQRIGRINRISRRVFRNIYIINLFPTEKGEKIIGKGTIVKTKLQMIHEILREDAQILDLDETPEAADIENRLNGAPEAQEKTNRSAATIIEERLRDCKTQYEKQHKNKGAWKTKIEQLDKLNTGLKTVAKMGSQNSLTVFQDNKLSINAFQVSDIQSPKPVPVGFVKALDDIACDESIRQADFEEYWIAYEEIKNYAPKLETKSASNLWMKAANVMQTRRFYKNFEEDINNKRKLMLDDCAKRALTVYTLGQLRDAKSADDLKRAILEWDEIRKMAGEHGINNNEGEDADKLPLLAFGTKIIEMS